MTPTLRILHVRPGRDRVGRSASYVTISVPNSGHYANRHPGYAPTETVCILPHSMVSWEIFKQKIVPRASGYQLCRPRPGEVPGLPDHLADSCT
jgi:hypothetical protein